MINFKLYSSFFTVAMAKINLIIYKYTIGRFLIPVGLSVLLFILTIFVIIIPMIETHLMVQKRTMVRELTQTAIGTINSYYTSYLTGERTLTEAQEAAMHQVRQMKYGEELKDYFWINDLRPVMLMHPYRLDLEGQDVSDYVDIKGKFLFLEFVDAVDREGAGYVDYMWQWKDDPSRIVPKISYVELFEPWDWIVGTGIYIEDVHEEISVITRQLTLYCVWILIFIMFLSAVIIMNGIRIELEKIGIREKLEQSEEKYRGYINHAMDGIVVTDNKGNVKEINPGLRYILGYSVQDLVGTKIINLVAEEYRTVFFHHYQKLIDSGHSTIELELMTVDGHRRYCIVDATKISDNHLLGFCKDLTGRRQAEIALKESEEKFRELSELLPQTVFESNENGFFTFINQFGLKSLGYTHKEIEDGLLLLNIIIPDDRPRATENIKLRYMRGGQKVNEYTGLRKDGTTFPILVYSSPIIRGQEISGLRGVIIDITDRKKSEERLQHYKNHLEELVEKRTKDLQEKQAQLVHSGRLASLGEMATGVAHELNQPLAIIRAQAELVQLMCDTGQEEMKSMQENIIEQVDRAATIINQMRGFARTNNDYAEFVNINLPINNSLIFFKQQFRSHNINLTIDLADNLPCTRIDPQKFEQIVVNFMSNARYAVDARYEKNNTEYQKKVDLKTFVDEDGNHVVLTVQDNGIGMATDVQEHCMDPFFTTKPVGIGTGLGLSIVYGIVKEFGGEVYFTSGPMKGTCFKVVLPVCSETAADPQSQQSAAG